MIITTRQLLRRTHLVWLAVAVGAVLLIEATAVVFANAEPLLVDPVELGELPSWYGLLSGLGVAAWLAAGSGAWVGSFSPTADPALTRALRSVGTASLILGLDDLARFHEVASDFFGMSEAAFFALYLPVVVWLILRGLRALMPEALLLVLAGVGFALSLLFDLVVEEGFDWYFANEILLEENAKLVGIACWTGALLMASVRAIRGGSRTESEPALLADT